MLATVLKGERARDITFAIIETFAKVRELKRELLELQRRPIRPSRLFHLERWNFKISILWGSAPHPVVLTPLGSAAFHRRDERMV